MIATEASAYEAEQARELRTARRRATGLLAAVTVAFLVTFALPASTALGYLRAALEAGMVGGLADWFAVVALFRHPLGIPIPHTAVIPKSKDGLGANLSAFVEDNFLDGGQVRERLVDPARVERFGAWLAAPANADRVAARGAALVVTVLDAIDTDHVVDRAVVVLRARLDSLEVARLAGESLEAAIRQERHQALVTATVHGLVDTMVRNRSSLRRRLGDQSPSWVPEIVDDLVFDRAEHVVRTFLDELASNPDHELRKALDQQLLDITRRLQEDPDVQARVELAVDDVVTDVLLRTWVTRWLTEAVDQLRAAADPAASAATLRLVASDALVRIGVSLRDLDGDLHARVLAALTSAAPQVAEIGQAEIGALIEATIDRWDAQDTSHRLELWMGRDLQFVRINGTVVGALVGLVLHAVSNFLG